MRMVRERENNGYPGLPVLLFNLLLGAGLFVNVVRLGMEEAHPAVVLLTAVASLVTWVLLMSGLFIVHPNQARVLQLFGSYVGSAKISGLRWVNPFYSKTRISLRIR